MNRLTSQTRLCHSYPVFQLGDKLFDEGVRDVMWGHPRGRPGLLLHKAEIRLISRLVFPFK
jgi:hypothetical protein